MRKRKSTPFLILLTIHSLMLTVILYKRGLNRTMASLIPNIGLAYLFEYVVLNLFNAYIYSPKFIKDPFIDKLAGAIFSQAIYVPITATFISLFKLGTFWKSFFSTYFVSIEKLFLHLRVHHNRWWKTIYTGILTFIYFFISDYWYRGLKEGKKFHRTLSVFFTFITIHSTSLFVFAVFRILRFGVKQNNWQEHFIIAPLYSIGVSIMYSLNAMANKRKQSWLIAGCLLLVDVLFYHWRLVKANSITWVMSIIPMHLSLLYIGKSVRNLYEGIGEQ
ncbi:hypothetical protein [Evansella tamaricis]|uniref:Uncharacterized protein n=1 Tax=Evansella tamaricis TaxID=2069301 RepID=A0ABS6JIU4_9BACI|nr:hypothetical protein [Evansella tamaricis]MBU9713594.1 hypothetical protein [Evansella tamaricis]